MLRSCLLYLQLHWPFTGRAVLEAELRCGLLSRLILLGNIGGKFWLVAVDYRQMPTLIWWDIIGVYLHP